MSNYTILQMFGNPRRGRQARNFTTNAPKILDLKSSSEQIFSRKLPLGAPQKLTRISNRACPRAVEEYETCQLYPYQRTPLKFLRSWSQEIEGVTFASFVISLSLFLLLYMVISPFSFHRMCTTDSDELVIKLNAVESTCAIDFHTVVDTSRSPVHNTPCPLHWVRDRKLREILQQQVNHFPLR